MRGNGGFLRISELAKEAGLPASTIRHYTDLGLLEPAMDTDGGHRLYDLEVSLKRLRLIASLTRRGKALPEIREEIQKRRSVVKILVVDDDEEVSGFLASVFESEKANRFEVRAARDGFAAGKACVEFLPDLMILDLMLPGINGLEVCRLVRRDPEMKDLKILAVTGYDTAENARALKEAGADGYLAKPFGIEDLRLKLKELGVEL